MVLPGLPTILPSGLTAEQVDCYLVTVRIEEISLRLRTNDVLPPADRPRSPSPPPEYGPDGRRTNLRQQRYIKKLEHERTGLIDVAIKRIPGYQAPGHLVLAGGKRNEKLYIPAKDFPDVNFIGLLIGPRGNTLKKLEVIIINLG